MKPRLHMLTVVAASLGLAVAAVAQAKGPLPSKATISGPGIFPPLVLTAGKTGHWAVEGLTGEAGFYQAVMPDDTRPMLPARPQGELGPKYTIRYLIPRWRWRRGYVRIAHIMQDVYPYAPGGAVTYMRPGQKLFNSATRGGWFRGGVALKETLVPNGLPSRAAGASSVDRTLAVLIGALVVLLLGGLAVAVALRRRRRAGVPVLDGVRPSARY